MSRNLFIIAVLIATGLSACSGGRVAETVTSNPPETVTSVPGVTQIAVPTSTETPAATNTPRTLPIEKIILDTSSTALPAEPSIAVMPRPTNPPDCTNSASFVTDVTIPDSANIIGGTTFTKTWRLRNTGTCVWGPDYTLTSYSEEKLGAPASVPLGVTFPGQTLDISVELTAPNKVGKHRGNFVIENPKGLIMKIDGDSRVWVILNVTTTVASTADSTSAATDAAPVLASTGSGDPDSTTAACDVSIDRANLTAVINAVNAYRAQKGLPAYAVNEQLSSAAQAHANDMACNQLFVHTGSDGSTPQTRVAATGYTSSSVTENVYGSYPPLTGQEAVNWWINDKTDLNHNRNLLSSTFTEIGVGYSFFDNYGYYVLVFAKP